MLKELLKDYIYPIAVFSGGMVGVGFFSLPYVAMKAGILVMLLYFLVLTALILVIDLIFCKISLNTPDFERFPGFVGHYLGKRAEAFTMISVVFSSIGVLLVYILVGGGFLSAVFQPVFGGSMLTYVFIYFLIGSIIVFLDIKVIAKVALLVVGTLFLVALCVLIFGFSHVHLGNIIWNWKPNIQNFFMPYGPLLFALWGVGLVPEIEEMLRGGRSNNSKKHLKTVVIISVIMVSVFYLMFTFLILGITGSQTAETALTGLKSFLPDILVLAFLLIGTLATLTAFIAQGLIFKKTLMFDLKIKHWQAFVMTCCPPLILFLLGLNSFIPIISLIGGVLLGIYGVLILLMYKKIGGKNIIIYPLSLVFLLGVIYEIMYFIKH